MGTEGTPHTPATSPLEVQALYKIVNLIGAAVHLDTTLASILKVLHDTLRMERATLALVDESGRHLVIRASYGLSVEEEQRGVYGLDEGIYGQVFSTGSPCIVPDVHAEPLFLNRTGARPRQHARNGRILAVPASRPAYASFIEMDLRHRAARRVRRRLLDGAGHALRSAVGRSAAGHQPAQRALAVRRRPARSAARRFGRDRSLPVRRRVRLLRDPSHR